MSTYAIDSSRQEMVATGIVEPVFEWIETPEGKRKPSEIQDRDADTGMPKWNVEVSYRSEAFGRAYTVNAMVTVGAAEQPRPAPFTHITFEQLRVDVFTNRAGGFGERWSAESIKQVTPETGRSKQGSGEPKAVAS